MPVVKSKKGNEQKKEYPQSTSGLAIASLVLGIVSFFPLVGVLLGVIAIVLGGISFSEIKKRNQKGRGLAIAGIILGVLGILFTFLIYGILFLMMFNPNFGGEEFKQQRVEVTKQMLIQDSGMIEMYKKTQGHYPTNITDLQYVNYTFYPFDHFLTPLNYTLSSDGQSYTLTSAGPDKVFGTIDDVRVD